MRQEWRRERDRADITTVVMPGLDPGIHPFVKEIFRRRWIAGSSPAMTS
jgi:hypothetical protein